jgi:tripartite ATP-independent transporter DctM subunit
MSIGLLTLVLVGLVLLTIFLGAPFAFALGGTAIGLAMYLFGDQTSLIVALNSFTLMNDFILVAIPLFIFIGVVLERSGLAEDLFAAAQVWFGPLRGGLAIASVGMATVFAALTGVSAASTMSTGVAALPSMLARGYNRFIAVGSIAAGGALGILIPPSVIMLVYAVFTGQSIGRLFAAGVVPGLMLSSMFILYIIMRCWLNPSLAPVAEEFRRPTWTERLAALRLVVLPLLLVALIIGSMLSGAATPSEAGAMGAIGAVLSAAAKRRVNLAMLRECGEATLRYSCMALWITLGALVFSAIYSSVGASSFIQGLFTALEINRWLVLLLMMLTFFILGMLMDPMGILLLTMPIFAPIAAHLGFDLVWFGILFVVNMEMAYLTPPFGFNLIYMRGITPAWITMGDIYKAMVPFIIIQACALGLVILFEDIALWLPRLLFGS